MRSRDVLVAGSMLLHDAKCAMRRTYGIGHGVKFQISRAYSPIARSLENCPEPAMLAITFRDHVSGLA